MATIVNGNELQLFLGSAATRATTTSGAEGERIPFAHAQTVSLSLSNSLIDTTTKSSNAWMEKISGQRSFTISADGLLDFVNGNAARSLRELAAYGIGGTRVYFEFGIENQRYVGSGFISSLEQSGGTDDAPTYSISIDNTGELTYDNDVTS